MPAALPLCFVMTSFEPGGTERQMIELLRRLDRTRWTVHVACFRAQGAWFGRVADAATSVVEFPVRSFKAAGAAREMWAFARWCREQRIALLHTTGLPSNIFGLPAAALARVPVRIANRREINPDKSAAQITLQRAAYAAAHRIVANSQSAAHRLRREGVPARKIAVIANGLDARDFPPRPHRRPRRRIVVVANLRPEKNHHVLIDAAPEILRRHPDAEFEFVGGGAGREALVQRARERGVLERITFSGHCHDVGEKLAAADVFVLPSRSEAFPNAVLEAMAAGLPVVASGVGGIREVIVHEHTGLLLQPGRPDALAQQICRVLEDEALANRLGMSARADVHARYSFERMVAQFEDLYLNELASRRVTHAAVTAQPPDSAPRLQSDSVRRLQPTD